ncbi:zinc finger protein 260 isoform X2 [Manduca sexta]|uniref:zinc finger protein 260 isoform X2 n=1 Tax=Manduca sexta TaxID=7130 RepID=UPI001182377F|nr:zinc finger protein 260 isoform X2 [Manduca sexta]
METTIMNNMCRCCASEGAFKDIKTTYRWMGEDEVYGDMLKDCFDITLSASDSESGICEVCITQLRNAANFKKQVLHTEEQFLKHGQNKLFKPNIVKVELPVEDVLDGDDNNLSGDDAFSGAEYELPIKTEKVEEPKTKKRAAAKASTSRSKKQKTSDGEDTPAKSEGDTHKNSKSNQSKVIHDKDVSNDWTVTIKRNNTEIKNVFIKPLKSNQREIQKHLHNIRTVLLHSNATPIRCCSSAGYECCFCLDRYLRAPDLKEHTLKAHNNDNVKNEFMKGYPISSYVVKLDITSLSCQLCSISIDTLEKFIEHLRAVHEKLLHSDIKNHILPFKFYGDVLECAVCSKNYESFKLLQEHMNNHYRNFACSICNAAFVNSRTLRAHSSRHKQGDFGCEYCGKVFDTHTKRVNHEKFVHIGDHRRNKCVHCSEKFVSYKKKMDHMVTQHGVQARVLRCMACDKTFHTRDQLTRHTKKDHLLERRHECDYCEMKFFGRKDLLNHMIKHTGTRKHHCDVCSKAFARKQTLREHLRIHADDRRFKCKHCEQAFVQKCSWKNHMRSKHGEIT